MTDTSVHSVRRTATGLLRVTSQHKNDREPNTRTYDHVIFATQANQILHMVEEDADAGTLTSAQYKALTAFQYKKSNVVVHTDPRVMPRDRSDWRVLNMFLPQQTASSASTLSHDTSRVTACSTDAPMATSWHGPQSDHAHAIRQPFNFLSFGQPVATKTTTPTPTPTPTPDATSSETPPHVGYFQTWNPHFSIPTHHAISTSWFERVLVTAHSTLEGIDRLYVEQGKGNIWFTGSYAYPGIPLLEGCVVMSTLIAERLMQTRRPWLSSDPHSNHPVSSSRLRSYGEFIDDNFGHPDKAKATVTEQYFDAIRSTEPLYPLLPCTPNALGRFLSMQWVRALPMSPFPLVSALGHFILLVGFMVLSRGLMLLSFVLQRMLRPSVRRSTLEKKQE